jgi:hypothetical protein
MWVYTEYTSKNGAVSKEMSIETAPVICAYSVYTAIIRLERSEYLVTTVLHLEED